MLTVKKTYKEPRITKITSSRPEVLCKKMGSSNFPKIHRETTVFESLLNKGAGPQVLFNRVAGPSFYIKKKPQHRRFPANFSKSLRTTNL